MSALRQAFGQGLSRALRHWRLLLPLYLCSLLLGLLQTWPMLVLLDGAGLYNPFLGDLARGSGDALANLFLGESVAAGSAGIWALASLPLTALLSLAYNFFSGGILSVYARTRPFWAGCTRTFWSFTALGALLLLLVLVVALLSSLVAGLAGAAAALIFAGFALQIVGLAGEYARAIAVAHDRRNPFVLLSRALGFFRRRPAGVLILALCGLLMQAALLLLYPRLGVPPIGPGGGAGAGLAAIAAMQLGLIAWLWVKLLRLAWAVSYLQAAEEPLTGPVVVS